MSSGRNYSNMSSGKDYIRIEKAAKARRTTANAVTYFLLAVWAVIVLFPFYWMLLTSVKSYSAYNAESIPKFLPCRLRCRITRMRLRRCRWVAICSIQQSLPW